jgi:hypothetical protein
MKKIQMRIELYISQNTKDYVYSAVDTDTKIAVDEIVWSVLDIATEDLVCFSVIDGMERVLEDVK